ncbi:F-type H+-transporting ATPase subunit gamma [Desulfobaculum xiamenense]|uniref:F-type H+-transporting ATPase subunit gamma n=1 Tax=Desulfobaculum xiamenense TaxID=995050 RepID=A0A846QNN9_9BACT|nr:F0F1 ATP synthase subunit gamma [Desulfobaculum xiamenense]NJB68082.1 F-type H+-transporting ATPase subunit gamma [Desulfobaculum xiamenense]
MITLEALEKRIATAGSLLSVVTSMKNLAAVNMRQFERAVEALDAYAGISDQCWRVLLRGGGLRPMPARGRAVCFVVGADQGLCGTFNEAVALRALEVASELDASDGVDMWASGERVVAALADAGRAVPVNVAQPAGLAGIATAAMAAVRALPEQPGPLVVVHNAPAQGGGFATQVLHVLPLDAAWLEEHRATGWPRRNLPMSGLPRREFFAHLFGQYLFISLYRAFGRSMAAENAARLASMQRAEKNIEEMRDELSMRHRELRQYMITAELLEVAAGFEALLGDATAV